MASLSNEQVIPEINTSAAVRTRSFGGCATCRSRHVKCDEGRPSCSTCIFAELFCQGYEKSIFFASDKVNGDESAQYRRPLFTEEERECMSRWLTSAVPPNRTLRVLSQIDSQCESVTEFHDFQVHRGCFGAFKLRQPQSTLTHEPLSPDLEDETSSSRATEHADDLDCILPTDTALSPWTQALVQSILDQSEQIDISPSSDMFDIQMGSSRIQEIFDGSSIPDVHAFSIPDTFSSDFEYTQIPPGAQPHHSLAQNYSTALSSRGGHHTVPQDAVFLLKHYVAVVIGALTPYRHSKTPWHVLFLPHAKNCLAALTLGEYVDHATLSTFYGTLAFSAFSLSAMFHSQMWLGQGEVYKQKAREHARSMLKIAYDVPKAAKYKSILMAFLTLGQVSMFGGRQDQSDCYLLEAEKFIRLRGLTRRKSRKRRLLHHCYVYMRILHETTFLGGTNSPQRHHVREVIESSGLVVRGQDCLSFHLMGWDNLDQEMMVAKSDDVGENDLHLAQPGAFPATMYPEIYGISESWFFLLSQVIRLGNEKDAAEHVDGSIPTTIKDFTRRAKAIERCINQLERLSQVAIVTAKQQEAEQHVQKIIHDGMQCALAIYFYRRIYDIDASLLQQKVISVRDWLLRYEYDDPSVVYGSAGFVWPAFMAACEAEDPEVQQTFSDWFKRAAQRSGLPCFAETLANVEQVWQEKRNPSGSNFSWLDLMRKNAALQGHV